MSDYETTPGSDTDRELIGVSGIGERRARLLRDEGYESVADLRCASQQELAAVRCIGKALAARIKADVGSPQT